MKDQNIPKTFAAQNYLVKLDVIAPTYGPYYSKETHQSLVLFHILLFQFHFPIYFHNRVKESM